MNLQISSYAVTRQLAVVISHSYMAWISDPGPDKAPDEVGKCWRRSKIDFVHLELAAHLFMQVLPTISNNVRAVIGCGYLAAVPQKYRRTLETSGARTSTTLQHYQLQQRFQQQSKDWSLRRIQQWKKRFPPVKLFLLTSTS